MGERKPLTPSFAYAAGFAEVVLGVAVLGVEGVAAAGAGAEGVAAGVVADSPAVVFLPGASDVLFSERESLR